MRLLMITECMAGGVLQVLQDISNVMSKRGASVVIVYSTRQESPSDTKIRSMFDLSIELIKVEGARELNPVVDAKMLYSYWRLIRKYKPDIVHLHSSKAGILGRLAALLGGRRYKVIYSPHGFSFLRTDISNVAKRIYWSIEKIAAKFLPGEILAVSESEYKEASKLIGERHAYCINNGIDFSMIERFVADNCNQVPVIGTVGRLSPQKNPLFAVEFFRKLLERNPSSDMTFRWIGGGELERIVRDKIDEYKMSDKFYITGWLSREEVLREVAGLDYYVHFSLWEGLPVSLLEAMALGKAPIASKAIGNIDVVVDCYCGRIIESVEEAVLAMEEYLNNPSMYKKMSLNAKERVYESFNLNKMCEEYEKFYTGCIRGFQP